ncbi:MAG: amidohydrolase [Pseudomonadales bacterium]|nr:amidohydrolase [Pseudomonadales bacterium]
MKRDYRIIDSDLHVIEPLGLWRDYIDPEFRDQAPAPSDVPGAICEVGNYIMPPHIDRPERQRAWGLRMRNAADRMIETRPEEKQVMGVTKPEAMLAAMDVEGIDIAVVFRSWASHTIGIDGQDPRFAAALSRAYNRWLADFCAADSARLKVAALIPLHDINCALEEAKFASESLGAITWVLPSQPLNQRQLYDRYYDPLWAAAEEYNVAISFHGNHAAYTDHLANRYHDNLVLGHAAGQPVEMMLALGAVLTGGVLSRYPRLRMAFLEGNCSWLSWWLWALDERWEKWGDAELFGQTELPSELFARHCYVSIEPDEELAVQVIAKQGDANLVLSTDWPHDDSAYPHAIDNFLKLPIAEASQRRILWDNSATLYGL